MHTAFFSPSWPLRLNPNGITYVHHLRAELPIGANRLRLCRKNQYK